MVEEIHNSARDLVERTHNRQLVLVHQIHQSRILRQLLHLVLHIACHSLAILRSGIANALQPLLIQPSFDPQQRLGQISWLLLDGRLVQLGCLDRSTSFMSHHNHNLHLQMMNRKLQRSARRHIQTVPSHANHKQVTQPLVKHNLHRHSRIRAPQDRHRRVLLHDQRSTFERTLLRSLSLPHPEPSIAPLQVQQNLRRRPRLRYGRALLGVITSLLHGEPRQQRHRVRLVTRGRTILVLSASGLAAFTTILNQLQEQGIATVAARPH
mmetsp:Transcript_54185/g.144463  ORF Transcript_54185/g.144463 Transcript_54185/m.144463 type:complete len:267 (-) Transcript_54185:112-912(-)